MIHFSKLCHSWVCFSKASIDGKMVRIVFKVKVLISKSIIPDIISSKKWQWFWRVHEYFIFIQKLLAFGVAFLVAINADVSHLKQDSGYHYPGPQPSFHDELSLPIPSKPASTLVSCDFQCKKDEWYNCPSQVIRI